MVFVVSRSVLSCSQISLVLRLDGKSSFLQSSVRQIFLAFPLLLYLVFEFVSFLLFFFSFSFSFFFFFVFVYFVVPKECRQFYSLKCENKRATKEPLVGSVCRCFVFASYLLRICFVFVSCLFCICFVFVYVCLQRRRHFSCENRL